MPDVHVGIREGFDQERNRAAILERPQHDGGEIAHLLVGVDEKQNLLEIVSPLERLNRTSALWQQFGFLHDVIVVDEDWNRALYYEEMPLAHIHASDIGKSSHYYTITLEFGKVEGDPFAIVRKPEPGRAEESVFLHPVVRRWCGHQLISERHLLEDLFGEWKKADDHIAPLRFFFMEQLLEMAEMNGLEIEEPAPQRHLLRSVAV